LTIDLHEGAFAEVVAEKTKYHLHICGGSRDDERALRFVRVSFGHAQSAFASRGSAMRSMVVHSISQTT
jgi:hypothetical protein